MSSRRRTRRWTGPLIAAAAALILPAGATAAPPPDLKVISSAEGVRIVAEVDGCTAALERAAAEGPFSYDNPCRQELGGRVGLLVRMLEAALPGPTDRAAGAIVRVASLEAAFPDFARRLAQQAARSPEWHGERARRDPVFAATTALRFSNTPPIYRELQEAMRPLRLAVRIAELAAVKVAPPPETPFADWLADRGIDQRRLLPWDAEVTFRLTPF